MQTFAGKTAIGSTARGASFKAYYGADGNAEVTDDSGFADKGVWSVSEDGRLCAKWQQIRGGERACFFVLKEGNAYKVYFEDGSLNATIDQIASGRAI